MQLIAVVVCLFDCLLLLLLLPPKCDKAERKKSGRERESERVEWQLNLISFGISNFSSNIS